MMALLGACAAVTFHKGPFVAPRMLDARAPVSVCPIVLGSTEIPQGPGRRADGNTKGLTPLTSFLVKARGVYFIVDAGVVPHDVMPGHAAIGDRILGFERHEASSLKSQLTEAGLDDKIAFIAVTHGHFDHAGELESFSSLPILMSPEEAQWIEKLRGIRLTLTTWRDASAWSRLDPRIRVIPWSRRALGPFSRSFDLFGDGSVLFVPTPGHTPGSVSVILPNANGSGVMLLGDAAVSAVTLRKQQPRGMIDQFFDDDRNLYAHTSALLHGFVVDKPQWQLYGAHDAELMKVRHTFLQCVQRM